MSQLLRILVMAIAWALLFLVSYFGCIKPECCGDPAITETVAPARPPATEDYAIVSRLGLAEVMTGDQWSGLRNDLLTRYRASPDQTLMVIGNYYASEPKPDGYDNMGLLRAAEIRDLMAPDVPADRIELSSQELTGTKPGPDDLWRAASFDFRGGEAPEDEVREIANSDLETQIEIRFPFNEAKTRFSDDTESYLEKLSERLKTSNERVSVVGHTDYVDTEAFNLELGKKRAEFLKAALVRYGADASKITTSSRGEQDAAQNNPSADQRRRDRKAILTINQ